jgi:hypothetical protein
MTNPPDFDDRLTSYLVSSPIRDVDPGATHIVSRARRRTKQRRIAGGAMASVALLTSAGIIVNRLQTPGTIRTSTAKVKPATDETTTTETTAVPQLPPPVFATVPGSQSALRGVDPSTLKWPASNITWERVDSTLSISNWGYAGTSLQKDGDTFLAVSTEPSKGTLPNPNEPYQPKNSLYLSKDGVSWQERPVPDLALASATMSDGALYAVGTANATAQVSQNSNGTSYADLMVAVSKDGKTWKNQILPLDLRGLVDKGGLVTVGSTQIAHFGTTVLVQSTVPVSLDATKYLPKNVSVDTWGYEQRGDAFVVFGPPSAEAVACQAQPRLQDGVSPIPTLATLPAPAVPTTTTVLAVGGPAVSTPISSSQDCEAATRAPRTIVGTYKFSDLGIDPALVAASQNPAHLFASTNGGPFGSVQAPSFMGEQLGPFGPGTGFLASVTDGFLLGLATSSIDSLGNQLTTTNVAHSADAKTWTDLGSFNGLVTSSGVIGGRFTMVVADERGGVKLKQLKRDGAGIEDVSDSSSPTAAALSTIVYQTAIGGAGYLGIFSNPWTSAEAVVKHNGFTFQVGQDPNNGIQHLKVTEDATGAVVADGAMVADGQADASMKVDKRIKWPIDGPVDITIVDEKGRSVVSINYGDLITQVSQQQQAEVAKSIRILDSQDGVNWSATSVSDLVDLAKVPVIGSSNLIVDKDRYIVNLLVARTDGGPADTITFVGRRG